MFFEFSFLKFLGWGEGNWDLLLMTKACESSQVDGKETETAEEAAESTKELLKK